MFSRVICGFQKIISAPAITRPNLISSGFRSFFSTVPKSSSFHSLSRYRRSLLIGAGTLTLATTFTAVYCYPKKNYIIIAGPGLQDYGEQLAKADPDHFCFIPVDWKKFPDGTDYIKIHGFAPRNLIRDSNVLFVASWHNNDVAMSQYHALCMLSESFIQSMTVLLPFIPESTMERVTEEGVIATANTVARLFNSLPPTGKPARIMVYDLHTLQNRFFFCGNALATLHTTFPLLIQKLAEPEHKITCIAFPDDGSEKRFGHLFRAKFPNIETVVCGKKRFANDPSRREIVIKNGNPKDHNVVIVDDLVRSGGTLAKCAEALKKNGAQEVHAFVPHAVFPNETWRKFVAGGKFEGVFKNFWVTNSNPTVSDALPKEGGPFSVISIVPQVLKDL